MPYRDVREQLVAEVLHRCQCRRIFREQRNPLFSEAIDIVGHVSNPLGSGAYVPPPLPIISDKSLTMPG